MGGEDGRKRAKKNHWEQEFECERKSATEKNLERENGTNSTINA